MKSALAVLLLGSVSFAGDVKETSLDEPPPPPGMHKLSRPETKAPTSRAAAVLAVPQDEALGDGLKNGAASFEALLQDALAARSVELVDLDALFPAPRPESIQHGDELFKQGRSAYDNLDTDGAAEKFHQAINFYLKHPVETPAATIAKAMVFLGATLAQNGDAPGAREAFQSALLIDSHAKPDSDLFGKDVQKAFQEAATALEERAKGTLAVDSVPPGAKVWLREEAKGTTPINELFLTAGRHQLLVRRPGYVPFGAFADVAPKKTAEIHAQLQPTSGLAAARDAARKLALPAPGHGSELSPDERAMGSRLGARYLVLAFVGTLGGELQVIDLATGNRLKGLKLAGLDKAAASSTADLVKQWIEHPPGPSLSERLPKVMKNWWFWAGVGAVAVIAAGSAVAVSGNHPHCTFADCAP